MLYRLSHVVRRPAHSYSPRPYSTSPGAQRRSPHAEWYSQVLPSMIPIALLGSTVYLALQLAQSHLSRERYLDEANARVEALEAELEALRQERVLPIRTDKETKSARWWFSQA